MTSASADLTAEGGGYKETAIPAPGLAPSSSSGDDAALTLAAQPDATRLGWRLQGWVRQSNLSNSSAAISNNRNTATLSNSQYSTPATGYGFNAAVRKLADWGSSKPAWTSAPPPATRASCSPM